MMSYSGIDFVYYVLGVNIIPADTINKKPLIEWTRYQTEELTEGEYLENKKNGLYDKGIAIVCGKIWRGESKGRWLNGIDLDNALAIKEFCTSKTGKVSAEEFISNNLVESHEDDPNSMHIYIITDEPITSKARGSIDHDMQPAIEVKSGGDKLMFSYPSMHHNKDSKNPVIAQWMFNELKHPTDSSKEGLENHIEKICSKYNIEYLSSRNKEYLREKLREKNKIPEGTRHDSLLTECNNLWWENIAAFKAEKITEDEIFQKFLKIASRCDPPHDIEDLERIFLDSADFVREEIEVDPARFRKAEKEFKKDEQKYRKQEEKNKAAEKEREEYARIKALSETIGTFEAWQKGMEIRYETLRKTILNLLPDVWPSLEFELSVRNIMHIQGNTLPFGGVLLGRPSSSKTVGIELFRKLRNTFYTDDFTPKSFLSHSNTVTKEDLTDIDMLPKIENKFFLTPELAPIFSTNEDELRKTMGVLTRVLDGQGYSSDSGVHGHRSHEREMIFSWIGATAKISPKVYELMSLLGPRLYFFRLTKVENSLEEYVEMLELDSHRNNIARVKKILLDYQDWFEACPIAVEDEIFKSKIRKIPWDKTKDSKETLKIIARLGMLLAPLRGSIPTWSSKDGERSYYNHGLALVEDPKRAMIQLRNLARGYALVKGRNYITNREIRLLIKVVLSTAPEERASIFDFLLDHKGTLSAKDIRLLLNVSTNTAYKTMNELDGLGLVENKKDEYRGLDGELKTQFFMTLKSEFKWFLGDDFKKLRNEKSEEFDIE